MLTPAQIRHSCRQGQFTQPTTGLAPGYIQANLVVLPQALAFDFLLFCTRNPKPCPILDVTEIGNYHPPLVAPTADLRTDLPQYRLWEKGQLVQEFTDITPFWQDDFIAFLLGCSFSFEAAMLRAGLPVRHIEEQKNVPMYKTNIACQPAGIFTANLVVSMRPLTPIQAIKAVEITSRFPQAHGAPIHIGDPLTIGINDLHHPDFGDTVTIHPGEIPVFWACGVTPQIAIIHSQPEIAITHSPGCMFITDIKEDQFT